jgi:hypothetical protein
MIFDEDDLNDSENDAGAGGDESPEDEHMGDDSDGESAPPTPPAAPTGGLSRRQQRTQNHKKNAEQQRENQQNASRNTAQKARAAGGTADKAEKAKEVAGKAKKAAKLAKKAGEAVATEGSSLVKDEAKELLRKGISGYIKAKVKEGKYALVVIVILSTFSIFIIFLPLILIASVFGAPSYGGQAAPNNPSTNQPAQPNPLTVTISGHQLVKRTDIVAYRIIANDTQNVSDIIVTYVIPAGADLYSATTGHYNAATRTVTWSTKEVFPTSSSNGVFDFYLRPTVDNYNIVNIVTATANGVTSTNCGQKSTPPGDPAPGFSCTGGWGIKPMSDNYYYATSFGCSKIYGVDKGDNCLPACPSSNIPECDPKTNPNITTKLTGRACEEEVKWYAADEDRFGCNSEIKITNTKTGTAVVVRVIDRGPSCSVENTAKRGAVDMSKDAANALFGAPGAGIVDRKNIQVEPVPNTTPLGPINACQ